MASVQTKHIDFRRGSRKQAFEPPVSFCFAACIDMRGEEGMEIFMILRCTGVSERERISAGRFIRGITKGY